MLWLTRIRAVFAFKEAKNRSFRRTLWRWRAMRRKTKARVHRGKAPGVKSRGIRLFFQAAPLSQITRRSKNRLHTAVEGGDKKAPLAFAVTVKERAVRRRVALEKKREADFCALPRDMWFRYALSESCSDYLYSEALDLRARGRRKRRKKRGERETTRPKRRSELYGRLLDDNISRSLRVLSGHASRVRYRTDNCRSRRRMEAGDLWKAATARRESRYRFSRENLPESSRSRRRVVDRSPAVRSLSSLLLLLYVHPSSSDRPFLSVVECPGEGGGVGWRGLSQWRFKERSGKRLYDARPADAALETFLRRINAVRWYLWNLHTPDLSDVFQPILWRIL